MLGHVLHFDGVAEVRLVGAVFRDRRVVRNARPVVRHRLAIREFLEEAGEHRLHRREHVFLLDEAHFDVELVELAGKAVGARIYVAEAGRDLEITVEARHHQQLLVLLRRLRQRVELALVNAARHQEVARAFWARCGQDRGRKLVEADVMHACANGARNLQPLHDDRVQRFTAQVEEAILQAQIFRIVRLAENRDRKLLGGREHLDLGRVEFDLAGRKITIYRTIRPVADFPVNADDPLRTHGLGRLESGAIGIGDDLRHAVVVAQVDEQHAAVVADAVHPARQPNVFTDIGLPKRAAGVRAITMQFCLGHCRKPFARYGWKSPRKSAWGRAKVKVTGQRLKYPRRTRIAVDRFA